MNIKGMVLVSKWSMRFWVAVSFAELILIVVLGVLCIDNVQYFRSLERDLVDLRTAYQVSAKQIQYQDKMLGLNTIERK
jgi:hypothetical protein